MTAGMLRGADGSGTMAQMKIAYGRGRRAALALLALLPLAVMQAHAEDGYDLWLRYHPVADEAAARPLRASRERNRRRRTGPGEAPTCRGNARWPRSLCSRHPLDTGRGPSRAGPRGLSGLLGTPEPVISQTNPKRQRRLRHSEVVPRDCQTQPATGESRQRGLPDPHRQLRRPPHDRHSRQQRRRACCTGPFTFCG